MEAGIDSELVAFSGGSFTLDFLSSSDNSSGEASSDLLVLLLEVEFMAVDSPGSAFPLDDSLSLSDGFAGGLLVVFISDDPDSGEESCVVEIKLLLFLILVNDPTAELCS